MSSHVIAVLLALALCSSTQATERIEHASERSFDDTVQQLQWAFGGHGATVVSALDYQEIARKVKVQTGRAVMFEILRRDWITMLLQEDPALGLLLPLRIYVFERVGASTIVSYDRPGAELEPYPSDKVRNIGRLLDQKLQSAVAQATSKPPTEPR